MTEEVGSESVGYWSSWLSWGGPSGKEEGEEEEEDKTQDSAGSESKEEEQEEEEDGGFVPPDEDVQRYGPPADLSYRTSHVTAEWLSAAVVCEESVEGLLQDYRLLMADARLLMAEQLWAKIEAWLLEQGQGGGEATERVRKEVEGAELSAMVARMRQRCQAAREALAEVESEGEWTHASSHSGTDTYYRMVEEVGDLRVKITSVVEDILVFDQLCVLREADLYRQWVPFINKSAKLCEIGQESLVQWYSVHIPFLFMTRDATTHVFCVDHLEEGIIVISGASVDPEDPHLPPGLRLPPEPKGFNAARMHVSEFKMVIRLTSPSSCVMHVLTTVHPDYPFLKPLVEFAVKLWGAHILTYMQKHARKIATDPVNNIHAQRMRDHPLYWRHYIRRAAQANKELGWPMVVSAAFEVEGDDSHAARLWRETKAELESETDSSSSGGSNGKTDKSSSVSGCQEEKGQSAGGLPLEQEAL